ncbi:MAG: hypothetical protein GY778_26895 [bacterium]|nr:hypothetical protein [bacterium]
MVPAEWSAETIILLARLCRSALYLMMVAVPGVVVAALIARRRRYPRGHCQRCGYDLTGNESGRCPECGKLV